MISQSSPSLVGQSESCEDGYATELPYVTGSRENQLERAARPLVIHYNQDLTFVQRSGLDLVDHSINEDKLWSLKKETSRGVGAGFDDSMTITPMRRVSEDI